MLVTDIGYALAGLTAVGIIFTGARFLLAPSTTAAAGFGIAAWHDGGKADSYLSVKGVRDICIASGLIAVILLAARMPHVLGWFELAASTIPICDAIIVLRSNGPKGHRLRRARRDGRSVAGHRRAPIHLTSLVVFPVSSSGVRSRRWGR